MNFVALMLHRSGRTILSYGLQEVLCHFSGIMMMCLQVIFSFELCYYIEL